jgi:hypothetical protein
MSKAPLGPSVVLFSTETSLLFAFVIVYFKSPILKVVPTVGPAGGITVMVTDAPSLSPSLSEILYPKVSVPSKSRAGL